MARRRPDDAWYESEIPLGREVVGELRRVAHRARARLALVLGLTVAVTAVAGWRIAKKPPVKMASVTLAVLEGSMASRDTPLPMAELRDYVANVLMPDAKLRQLVEARDLFPLRKKQGPEFGIAELRDSFEITVYRNYFLYDYDSTAARSARIELTVTSADGDLALAVARDLAGVVVSTADEQKQEAADTLLAQTEGALARIRERAADLDRTAAAKARALAAVRAAGDKTRLALAQEEAAAALAAARTSRGQLEVMAREASMDQITAAVANSGLGLNIQIVDERPAPKDDLGRGRFRLAVAIILLGLAVFGLLALLISTFDDRIRDPEDVVRAGLAVVGSVPRFPGDEVGSLRARGLRRTK